ncbi:gas vesicle protein [Amycolatopsis nigrescens]|uniref:gas vesicle protein n=1 Tax=Amycolatopsis nigrescens TaxID=381445 RepID=UPI00036A6031|nr:gas vesicle protein [Amycolatopsis nigrescens]
MTAEVDVWSSGDGPSADPEIALVDLLDRLLAGGVVLTGDVTLSIAGVDLVHISLRALITSVRADRPPVPDEGRTLG